jgi:CheY-like chemotaxis protein
MQSVDPRSVPHRRRSDYPWSGAFSCPGPRPAGSPDRPGRGLSTSGRAPHRGPPQAVRPRRFESINSIAPASPGRAATLRAVDSARSPRPRPEAGGTPGARILLVEDDRAVAEMYRLKLERDGYAVQIAEDGERALELARGGAPDVVLLDVRLPKRDGLQVLGALRRDPRTRAVPIVVLSNYSENAVVERSLALGATEYLVKAHTTPEMLSAGLRRWLDGEELPPAVEPGLARAERPETLPPGH